MSEDPSEGQEEAPSDEELVEAFPGRAAAAAIVAQGHRLYSPAAIAVHTFLFSPLIGGLLAALNWRRLGQESRARQTAMLGVGAVVALVALGYFFPDLPGGAFAGGPAALAVIWHKEHKPHFEAHQAAGGESAAWWRFAAAGLAVNALFIWALLSGLSIDQDFQRGVAAFEDARYEVAEREFRAVLDADPERDDARYNLGLTLIRRGDLQEARRELGRVRNSSELAQDARELRMQLPVTQ